MKKDDKIPTAPDVSEASSPHNNRSEKKTAHQRLIPLQPPERNKTMTHLVTSGEQSRQVHTSLRVVQNHASEASTHKTPEFRCTLQVHCERWTVDRLRVSVVLFVTPLRADDPPVFNTNVQTHNYYGHLPQTHLVHAHFYVRGRGPRYLFFVLILSCPDANIQQSLVLLRPLSQRSSSARGLYLLRPGIREKNTWSGWRHLWSSKKQHSASAFHLKKLTSHCLRSLPASNQRHCCPPASPILQVFRFSLTTLYQLPYLRACGTCPSFFWPTRQCILQSLSTVLFWLLPSALYVF